jgi:predicted ATP-grasp superfamily ATP-dependent carboligase
VTESTKKPAVVVQGSGLNALGVIRSLALERVAIRLVDRHEGGPAIHSRYAKPQLYRCEDADADDALIRALQSAVQEFDAPPVLLLTQEAAVAAVSKHRARLAGRFRVELPDADTVADLTDKQRFQLRAEALGFPVPRAAHIDNDVAAASTLTYPCILKPAHKSEHWERTHKKAYRFENFADLEIFWRGVEQKPPFIVQEWIEGGDADVYFTLVQRGADGTRIAFTGRKIRQWPPLVGGTASCMPAPEVAAELDALTQRFFDAVGLIGLASMEYKRDSRNGRFVMVEPTIARTDYQEEVATLNGVNLVQAAYRSIAGLEPLPERAAASPAIWRDATSDENSKAANPGAPYPAEASGMRVVDAVFRTDDPGPWLQSQYSRVRGRLRRMFR